MPLYQLPDRNNGNGAVFHSGLFFIFGGDIGGGQICSDVIFQQNNVNETWVWDSAINVVCCISSFTYLFIVRAGKLILFYFLLVGPIVPLGSSSELQAGSQRVG